VNYIYIKYRLYIYIYIYIDIIHTHLYIYICSEGMVIAELGMVVAEQGMVGAAQAGMKEQYIYMYAGMYTLPAPAATFRDDLARNTRGLTGCECI
jgi:hypothetical protein